MVANSGSTSRLAMPQIFDASSPVNEPGASADALSLTWRAKKALELVAIDSPQTPMRALSHAEMIARGSGGSLGKAYERFVPIDRLDGLEPRPSNEQSADGLYSFGARVLQPIEVAYDADLDVYMVHAGNHRIAQAQANGQTHILAFVEPDRSNGRDYIGAHPLRSDPDEHLFIPKAKGLRP